MEDKKNYYWSLIIEPNWLSAAIWTMEGENIRVMAMSTPFGWGSLDELVDAANNALSEAVDGYPQDSPDPSQTVFGVSPSWVSEGNIKPEYLDYIRQICTKLSLKPSGFVVLPEAIAHFVKVDEGSPLTGIIIGVGANNLDLTIFRLGNLVGTVEVGRSVSIVDDVVEGLARFKSPEHLPSRIMLYNGKVEELEEVRQNLINEDWLSRAEGKVQFLHTPKIEIVDPKSKIIATSLAGGSELGEVKTITVDGEEKEDKEQVDFETDDVGQETTLSESSEVTPEELGFVLGEDIEKVNTASQVGVQNTMNTNYQTPKSKFNLKSIFGFIPSLFNKIPFFKRGGRSLPKSNIPINRKKKILTIAVGVGVVLFVSMGLLWWWVPKAQVAVYVSPQNLERSETVIFDEAATNLDTSNSVVPAKTVSVNVSDSKTQSTTGTKVVGEEATGKISIRNGTAVEIEIDAGTTIIGPNDLSFTVNDDISVAEASSPSSPGSASVSVTASDIGADYNLAKGETFVVGNYPKSEVDAVAEEDFSGGSSEEIVAVSQSDMDNLEKNLLGELETKGRQEIENQISQSQVFIPDTIESEVVDTNFNHSEGDEASELTLDMELKVEGLVVERKELNEMARSLLSSDVPDGFVMRDEQLEFDYDFIDEDDGEWEYKIGFTANLLPDIDPDVIVDKISGKTKAAAEQYLHTIPGFTRAEVMVSPPLPGRLRVIPYIDFHTTVEVVADY